MPIVFQFCAGSADTDLVDQIARLCAQVFPTPVEDLRWRIANMPRLSVASAHADGLLAGFKIGYAQAERRYYSWLGAVHPQHRRQGIAARLAERQHAWAAAQGFAALETAADQDNVAMTRANLDAGFRVCGTKTDPGRVQVLFRKELVRAG